jgi:hypothetical protein
MGATGFGDEDDDDPDQQAAGAPPPLSMVNEVLDGAIDTL